MTEDPSLPQQQRQRRTLPPRATVDGERLIAVFAELVEPLGRALPASSEVVLHDLSKLPDSIVAVQGDVTGRRLGDPATDLLLERVADGDLDHQLGYETRLPDGRRMQSSTMIIRDVSGHPVAALCINTDISAWLEVRRIADAMIAGPIEEPQERVPMRSTRPDGTPSAESFPHDVDELAAHLVHAALMEAGIEVDQMKKEHKLRFVETLQSKGFFMLREAVDMTAAALGVSRFTIYNYLNELDARASTTADPLTTEKASDKPR
ncbi:helix-turn-helix transcriptional regulator [Streptomyces sp. NPDC055210]